MVVQSLSDKTIEQYEEEILKRIENVSYILHGLENYGPYRKVIDMFKETRQGIDDNWHLVSDPMKLAELRMTKYAVNTLIEYIPNLSMDLEKLQMELSKLKNPDDIVDKDYDSN